MSDSVQVELNYKDPEGWRALVPIPFWTTKTVPFWKRFNEANWRPQCMHCKEVFKFKSDYDKHYMIYVAKWPSDFVNRWPEVAKSKS